MRQAFFIFFFAGLLVGVGAFAQQKDTVQVKQISDSALEKKTVFIQGKKCHRRPGIRSQKKDGAVPKERPFILRFFRAPDRSTTKNTGRYRLYMPPSAFPLIYSSTIKAGTRNASMRSRLRLTEVRVTASPMWLPNFCHL